MCDKCDKCDDYIGPRWFGLVFGLLVFASPIVIVGWLAYTQVYVPYKRQHLPKVIWDCWSVLDKHDETVNIGNLYVRRAETVPYTPYVSIEVICPEQGVKAPAPK